MAREAYLAKLRDPRWQKLRLEILERDGWRCGYCNATDKTLHVHHLWYEDDAEPWDADPSALQALCEECHKWFTTMDRVSNREIPRALRRLGVDPESMFEVATAISESPLEIEPCEVVALVALFFSNPWFRQQMSGILLNIELNIGLMSADRQRKGRDAPPSVGL